MIMYWVIYLVMHIIIKLDSFTHLDLSKNKGLRKILFQHHIYYAKTRKYIWFKFHWSTNARPYKDMKQMLVKTIDFMISIFISAYLKTDVIQRS